MTLLDLRTLPPDQLSWVERLALLPEDERKAFYSRLTEEQAKALRYEWDLWARPDQLPPEGFWRVWVLSAGRGAGKSRSGAEWVRKRGPKGRVGMLVAANPRDARDFMLEGPSGVLTISPNHERPKYEPSKLLLTWPSGATAHVRSAEDPEGLRGPSLDWVWADEICKWAYQEATWHNLRMGLREGVNPQTVITTTPRPLPLFKKIVGLDPVNPGRPLIEGTFVAQRVSTFRNAANLAPEFLQEMVDTYMGTTLGEQELMAVLVEDVEGALWNSAMIEADRLLPQPGAHEWTRNRFGFLVPKWVSFTEIAVGVDPPGSPTTECGIIVCGADAEVNRSGFVLDDRSTTGSPGDWAKAVVRAYHDWQADVIVVEDNYGGDMVEHTVRTVEAWTENGVDYPSGRDVRIVRVHATRGKEVRAQPIVGKYEQHRVHHLGRFSLLEAEQTTWVPGTGQRSPNRLDGLVWALTRLLLGGGPSTVWQPSDQRLPTPAVGQRSRFGG